MHIRRTFATAALMSTLVGLPLAADWPVAEKIDFDAVYRIKEEGLQRSKVMELESYLTDVYGPRLTNSPGIKEAAEWAQKTMKEWGLVNVRTETWPFGRGWQNQRMAALVDFSGGDGGTVFVQSPQGVSRDPKEPLQAPQVTIAVEHYGRIARTLDKKMPVTLQMDIENTFDDADQNAFNIVGEIPGGDKADEIVMIGAHFDSWHSGTGATDNAAGSAVMMEAMRILKASGVKLRRTVRIGLWSGEEQGLLGSKEYVKAHFGDPATMQLKPEHAKLAGYFNVDNGTGQIRGVYLQGNEAVAPIFQAWMEPFHNMGMTTLAIRNTGGTDHLSYDTVGLPGFQFIQDEVEYDSRTHHSNMDVYERVQAQDMMRNAVIVASFVYNTANRDEKLPRKPLPNPSPAAGRGTAQP